jgi:hypothetical protein
VESPRPGHTLDATSTKRTAVCCQSRVRRLAGQLSKLLL